MTAKQRVHVRGQSRRSNRSATSRTAATYSFVHRSDERHF